MNTKQIIAIAATAAILILGTLTLTMVLTDTPAVTGQSGETSTINVSGTCEISVPADVAYIQLGVETQDKDVKTAQEENAESMQNMIDAVMELGLAEEDITTSNYSIYPYYNYNDGSRSEEPDYYVVNNTVKLRVKDLDILGEVIDIATQAGANQAYNIYFDAEDTVQSQDDALAKAVEDAMRKAAIIAEAAGLKVEGIKTITDQTYYSTGYYDYEMEERAVYDSAYSTPVMGGEVDVTANVYVEVIVGN